MTMVGAATTVRYRDIARRLIAKETPRGIAENLGLSVGTLYVHMRNPAFRAILRELDMQIFNDVDHMLGENGVEVTQRISESQGEAFDSIVHLMRYGSKDGIKLQAAKDLLDRGGSSAPRKVQIEAKVELRETSIKLLLHSYAEAVREELKEAIDVPSNGDPHMNPIPSNNKSNGGGDAG